MYYYSSWHLSIRMETFEDLLSFCFLLLIWLLCPLANWRRLLTVPPGSSLLISLVIRLNLAMRLSCAEPGNLNIFLQSAVLTSTYLWLFCSLNFVTKVCICKIPSLFLPGLFGTRCSLCSPLGGARAVYRICTSTCGFGPNFFEQTCTLHKRWRIWWVLHTSCRVRC
jgi:hypothetical protein